MDAGDIVLEARPEAEYADVEARPDSEYADVGYLKPIAKANANRPSEYEEPANFNQDDHTYQGMKENVKKGNSTQR